MTRANTQESMVNVKRGDFLGVLYLDSRRPAAFSKLDRQILDALAADAASILDNARLVESERERQRLEEQINIARTIQQGLLRGISANSLISPSMATICPVCPSVGTTSMSFRLAKAAQPFSLPMSPAKASVLPCSPPCCRARFPP